MFTHFKKHVFYIIVGALDLPIKPETSFELKEYESRIEELRTSEKLLAELNETLEVKLQKTEALRLRRLDYFLDL